MCTVKSGGSLEDWRDIKLNEERPVFKKNLFQSSDERL